MLCPLVEIAMQKSKCALFALAVVAATAAGTANAVNCYIVLDSKNAVVYQDVFPPVDMSEQGDAARAAIRQRGQFLMMMDALQCPRLIAASGPSGAPATVEQIVAGMRSYGGSRGPSTHQAVRLPCPDGPVRIEASFEPCCRGNMCNVTTAGGAPTRATAAIQDVRSTLVLERQRDARAISNDLAVGYLDIELDDVGDAQITK
jgi:hypothetical protein